MCLSLLSDNINKKSEKQCIIHVFLKLIIWSGFQRGVPVVALRARPLQCLLHKGVLSWISGGHH